MTLTKNKHLSRSLRPWIFMSGTIFLVLFLVCAAPMVLQACDCFSDPLNAKD